MIALIFDTETTGLPNYKLPITHPSQPFIVQLAAMLADDEGHPLAEFSYLVRSDMTYRYTIGAEAAAVHGITQEATDKYGISITAALQLFRDLYSKADIVVAHNIDFDLRMLRRYGDGPEVKATWFADKPEFDTKAASTELCKLPLTDKQLAAQARNPGWSPPGGWPKYKDPHLYEVYEFLFNETFDGAHDAMVDVRACMRVFYELKKRGLVK
jgi:DNA polymerase-3 subunit epsilon